MKFLIILAIVGCSFAQQPRTAQRPEDITILRSEQENNGDGTYSYLYETSDGTSAAQKGYLKPAPPGSESDTLQVAEGYFQYYSPEGQQFKLDYIADENGFQPKADHLPTSPPIPEEIAKALAIIYQNAGDQQRTAAASNQQFQQQQPRQQAQFRAPQKANRRF